MSFRRFANCGLLIVYLSALPVHSQSSASQSALSRKDAIVLSSFPLTMGSVRRAYEATDALERISAGKPAIQAAVDGARNANDGLQSLAEVTKALSTYPIVVAELGRYGFTARTYALTQRSAAVTGMAITMMELRTPITRYTRDAGVNPANVKLFRNHKEKLQRSQKNIWTELTTCGSSSVAFQCFSIVGVKSLEHHEPRHRCLNFVKSGSSQAIHFRLR